MMDTNLNLAECLTKTYHFGFTRVHNVCSGSVTDVTWGFFDWLAVLGLIGGSLAFLALIFAFAFIIWSDR